ncbi:LysM domain/BON superfamily protein [Planctomyces sp. SH-PL14]|nr:LysM domain/BON superfamily protein [Planctomyces sp. SH-PL14]
MHRDAKLGLVLAILVMGFAAAFCCPRQKRGDASGAIADLQLPQIDHDLKARHAKVYLPVERPVEPIRPVEPVSTAKSDPQTAASPVTGPASETDSRSLPASGASTPLAWSQTPEPELDDADEVVPAATAQHVVAPGDTLSSIALKRLGSSTQYARLFEANRDVLSSPDALQIGMVLTIPGKETPVRVAAMDDDSSSKRRERGPAVEPAPSSKPRTEPVPTLAEPYLPTNAIPGPASLAPSPSPSSSVAPTLIPVPDEKGSGAPRSTARFGAASVGASLMRPSR